MSRSKADDPVEKVRKLSEQAAGLSEIDINIPLMRYFRAAKEIIRTAQYYEQENSLENAFILYSKYVTLFVEKFPQHPQYKQINATERQTNYKDINRIFSKAESVKKQLLELYSKQFEEQKLLEIKAVEKQKTEQEELLKIRAKKEEDDLKEIEERFEMLRTREQLNILDVSLKRDGGLQKPPINDCIPPSSSPPPSYASAICDTVFPSSPVNKSSNLSSFEVSPSPVSSKPTFDRSLKPSGLYFGDIGLKTVCIPSDLAQEFLNMVQGNTNRNIETCAILCGKLQRNKWMISHVLIPNQCGKSDSCDIENDEEIVHFQDVHNLVTLGWIHTHPSQTAFLSSVDQHTHWPYQKLLPEAVAIVCAPKFKEIGYFHLTPNFGMEFLQKCRGQGFHEHPIQPPLFQTCPHIQLENFSKTIFQDLRRNR